MSQAATPATDIQQLLHLACDEDEHALNELIQRNGQRLSTLTRRMLGDFPRVKRWADTDDVLQNALLRLLNALRDVKPASPREFLGLANLQIRRELIDLARHYYGPQGLGANHESKNKNESGGDFLEEKPDLTNEPGTLAQWGELHEAIDALGEDEREVVGLLFYQGLTQAEAAELLDVSVRTVQRRWHAALGELHRVWNK